ncbi:carotenoid oxygenase family protein [Williamsia sp. 1135]|uniref:carotenoid oxygenase family protein n=1 Tax=Williamsia sp. 1135 TaxID=1889262 RepID=UPI000A1219C7|nr:carotenoid oxygenase family protein [Williamsia sp. 1135]ORM32242.1 carotenoid oxygenase [Williamsia sp. 1135]
MALQTHPTVDAHPYLTGNYAPVDREITETDLPVTGRIPDFLDGRYVRIGPNPLGTIDPARYEWFLGDGMTHGLRISGGRALWYRNRWVRSADISRRLGERWPGGTHRAGFDFPANTNVIAHAGRTLAVVEGGATAYELTDDLDTVGSFDFCGTLRGGYTGHPKTDPKTGELHAISYSPLGGPAVRYTVAGVDGRINHVVDIPLPDNTMMHDFALTEHHVIVFDLPVVLNVRALGSSLAHKLAGRALGRLARRHPVPDMISDMLWRGSARMSPDVNWPYRWDQNHEARFGVLPRGGSAADLRWFSIDGCFIYHTLNAYENGNVVVLEAPCFPTSYEGSSLPFDASPTLERWSLDLHTGAVRQERIDDRGQEFPRIDERLLGQPHRFGYTVGFDAAAVGEVERPQMLFKHDLVQQTSQTTGFGPGTQPGEFVFVAGDPEAAEDDGVLMGFVYDGSSNRSDLVILDATTLEAVARIHLPTRVPNGFHGNWIPAEATVER